MSYDATVRKKILLHNVLAGVTGLLVFGLFAASTPKKKSTPSAPNIIFIVLDDTGIDQWAGQHCN